MSKNTKNINRKLILYLINNLGSKVEGKKKLMKLMFLIEHFDLDSGVLSSKQHVGNKFQIYTYGVYSDSVMGTIWGLVDEKVIRDGFPLSTKKNINVSLDKELKGRVDEIIKLFGDKSGYNLEVTTLEMLGIKPKDKNKHFGNRITSILNQS